MLQPTVRRTWSPRGQTPLQHAWARHDRLSVVSALTVSPNRRRLGLYFDVRDHNLDTDAMEDFLRRVRRRLGRDLIVVLDRWSVHRSTARRLVARWGTSVAIEWLPTYAPELNPVEQIWSHTKYADLANFTPHDLLELGHAVTHSIRTTRAKPTLLRSFFQHAKLYV